MSTAHAAHTILQQQVWVVGLVARHVSLFLLSLLRRPALLQTVPETSSLNMVSTRQQACTKRTMVTQTEGLHRNVAVQVSGCRECQSLLLPREDGKDATCVRCKQVDELLSLVVELREEVERLRTIRECEREIDWWSDSLRERCRDCTPQTVVDPLLCCSRAQRADSRGEEEWQQVPAWRHR